VLLTISNLTYTCDKELSGQVSALDIEVNAVFGLFCPDVKVAQGILNAFANPANSPELAIALNNQALLLTANSDEVDVAVVAATSLNSQQSGVWGRITARQSNTKSAALSSETLKNLRLEQIEQRFHVYLLRVAVILEALSEAISGTTKLIVVNDLCIELPEFVRFAVMTQLKEAVRASGKLLLNISACRQDSVRFADKLAVVIDRQVQQIGTPRELYLKPNNIAVAIATGDVNVLSGELYDRKLRLDDAVVSLSDLTEKQKDELLIYQDRPVKLLVRPQYLLAYKSQSSYLKVVTRFFNGEQEFLQVTDGENEYIATDLSKSLLFEGDSVALSIAPHSLVLL
jgi:ABC-type Fe3+/spermidine/putrescine transport system ATPase subunit